MRGENLNLKSDCVTQRAHLRRNRYEVAASERRGGDSAELDNVGQHCAKHDGGVNCSHAY